MTQITIAGYIAPRSTKSGKLTPAKWEDTQGLEWMVSRDLEEEPEVGQTYEVAFTQTTNGVYVNRNITKLTLVNADVAKTSVTIPAKSEGWRRDPSESNLIVRQTALKAAVEFLAPATDHVLTEEVLNVADKFVAWVHGEGVKASQQAATPSSGHGLPPISAADAAAIEEILDGTGDVPHPADVVSKIKQAFPGARETARR